MDKLKTCERNPSTERLKEGLKFETGEGQGKNQRLYHTYLSLRGMWAGLEILHEHRLQAGPTHRWIGERFLKITSLATAMSWDSASLTVLACLPHRNVSLRLKVDMHADCHADWGPKLAFGIGLSDSLSIPDERRRTNWCGIRQETAC